MPVRNARPSGILSWIDDGNFICIGAITSGAFVTQGHGMSGARLGFEADDGVAIDPSSVAETVLVQKTFFALYFVVANDLCARAHYIAREEVRAQHMDQATQWQDAKNDDEKCLHDLRRAIISPKNQ